MQTFLLALDCEVPLKSNLLSVREQKKLSEKV